MNRTVLLGNTRIGKNVIAAYDVGGTKVAVRVYDTSIGTLIFERRYTTSNFQSTDGLLKQSFGDIGVIPAYIAMVIAGPREDNGDIQMTNQNWPLFEVQKTAQQLGVVIETWNDVIGAAAGLKCLDANQRQLIKPGTESLSSSKLVITVSTGIGDAFILPDGTPVPGEAGHTTWQAHGAFEEMYLLYLRNKYTTDTITVEVAVSGSQGFDNLYNFMVGAQWYTTPFATPFVKDRVAQCRHRGVGIGPVITERGMAGEPFCKRLLEVYGSILGEYTRNRAVSTLSKGGVFFIGGVMQAEGVAEYIILHTPFLSRFLGRGAQHTGMLAAMPIYLATDPEISVKGGVKLAEWLQQHR